MGQQIQRVETAVKANYIRLAVEVDSVGAVEDCSGVITLITKNSIPIMSGENLQLPFTPAEQSDALSKTVKNGVIAYLDVLALTERNVVIVTTKVEDTNFYYPNSFDHANAFSDPADYKFTIVVSGRGIISSSAILHLGWTGDWQTAELSCHAGNV